MLMISSFFPSIVDAITLKSTASNSKKISLYGSIIDDISSKDAKDEQKNHVRCLSIEKRNLRAYTLRLKLDNAKIVNGTKYASMIKVFNDKSNFATTINTNAVNVLNPAIECGNEYYCIVHEFKQNGNADVMVERKTISGDTWEGWYFEVDGVESIPDVDYWGSGEKFYATAVHSNKDYFYYIEIPDIRDENSWEAHIVDWSNAEYDFDFYDSTSVGCYNGYKVLYAVIGSTDYPGYECVHSPMILYTTGENEWTIRWFPGLEDCSHISLDIDQETGIVYLSFDKDNDLYLIFNDYDDGLDDDWSVWHVDEGYDMRCPDVSAGHGVVYMAAQAKCEGDWDPWFFYSLDNDVLYYGWLLGEEINERYPRVDLTYDGSHIIGNWIFTKNSGLYSGPNDKINGDDSVAEHYRCCDVASGLAAWTITSEEYIITNDIQIGGYTPIAYIDTISPNPANKNEEVMFKGHGWDPDGWITSYKWESSIDGQLSTQKEFSTSSLLPGTHTIYFSVRDSNGQWSYKVEKQLDVIQTSTEFRPADADTSYSYNLYQSWYNKKYDEEWGTSWANASAETSVYTGYVGGAVSGLSSDIGSAEADASALIGVNFYTGHSKSVHVTAVIYLTYGEVEIGIDTRGETKIGHQRHDDIIWDEIVDPYYDWDYILSVIFNLLGIFGLFPGDIIQAITMAATIADYASLAQEIYTLYNTGDAKRYTIEFDMITKDGDYNKILFGGNTSMHTAWFGQIHSGFIGLVDKITIDGIAPPSTPTFVSGPSTGYAGESYEFCVVSRDPNRDKIRYFFDWGDNQTEWTEFGLSETSMCKSHVFSKPGIYTVRVKAQDEDKMDSEDWDTHTISIKNRAPEIPTISGSTRGQPRVEYIYTFVAKDPDGHDVYYYIEWGDGQREGWLGPYSSGEKVKLKHTWEKRGKYIISAKAKDPYDAESNWGTLEVSMPRNRLSPSHLLFLHFLKRFAEFFPLSDRGFFYRIQ